MRRVTSVTLLAVMTAVSWVGLKAGHADFPTLDKVKLEAEALERGTVLTTKKDVDVTLKGCVRQGWRGFDKMYTLRASNKDQNSFFKTAANLDFAATYGNKTYGKSAADAFVRLSKYMLWNGNETMEPQYYTYTDLEEAWINLHFGTFFKAFDNWCSCEKHPVSVKVGYFPYSLGRGIAFGDAEINISYLGWGSFLGPVAPNIYREVKRNHPGILVHGYVNKNISYDLYYTKQRERSKASDSSVWGTWDTVQGRGDKLRGVARDRDLWTARMDFRHNKSWGNIHAQPYVMYCDAPELRIDHQGDSSARLGNAGLMIEYKKGGFTINAEGTRQFGHQILYPEEDLYNSGVNNAIRFDYRGFMGLVDMQYEFEKVPVAIAAAGAYISGDKYPFNDLTEKTRRYKGFIPYGDYNYVGKFVHSQVLLEERKLPRPLDRATHNLNRSFNNIEEMSNLAYLGLGTTWKPFKDEKEKLMLQTNLLWFWETIDIPKWDEENSTEALCSDASRMLGTELNFEAQYRPVPNCILLAQFGCFIPGQLYKDLDGQPNNRTYTGPKAAEVDDIDRQYGLGHEPVFRTSIALDYKF